MKKYLLILPIIIILSLLSISAATAQSNNIWVSAYYGGWMQGDVNWTGHMTADKIDYSAVTHIIHFAIQPKSDGTIDFNTLYITPANSASLIKHAKATGTKVLISIGGEYTENAFLSATNDTNRQKFINNLINFMISRGYDGIDLNWEPISSSSVSQIKTFVNELSVALDAINPRPILVASVAWEPTLFAQLQDKFEQINIMTYDLNGNWLNGSWFNAPTYDGGYTFPAIGAAPSANSLVNWFASAGIKPAKLGIGIGFYGYVNKGGNGTPTGGVTAPGQIWTTAPTKTMHTYYDIMDKFYKPANYKYDSAAGAAYLSFNAASSSEDMFITYDDESSIFEKIKYVKNKGIGGVILFQLGGGWRPNMPIPDSLLKSVKNAVLNTSTSTPTSTTPTLLTPTLVSPINNSISIPLNPILSWNASNGSYSYTVEISTSSTFSNLIINQNNIATTSLQVKELLKNTAYYWRVKAANNNQTSGWSNAFNFTTIDAKDTVITNFKGAPTSTGIILSWQTTTEYNNKGFYIQRRPSTSTRWSEIGFVSGSGTSPATSYYSYNDKKIRHGRTYNYQLKQINTDNTYSYSHEIIVINKTTTANALDQLINILDSAKTILTQIFELIKNK